MAPVVWRQGRRVAHHVYRQAGPTPADGDEWIGSFPRPESAALAVRARLHLLRRDHGAEKYDSLLQVGNGRDASIDQLQESLDRIVYEIQVSLERRAMVEALELYRTYLDDLVKRDGWAETARARFDELLSRSALCRRADELATAMLGPPG